MLTYTDVIAAIVNGELDDNLDDFSEALNLRRKEAGRKQAVLNSLTLKPGAQVRLRGLRPKYLNGRTGTVMEQGPYSNKGTSARPRMDVLLDMPVGKFFDGKVRGVPADCIAPLD